MNGVRIDPSLPLEILNGAGMVLEAFFLGWLGVYLWRETRRRHLGLAGWLTGRLPPSMNFALAVFVCDGGVWLRTIVIWSWRRFFAAGDFNAVQAGALALGAVAIVVGSLCKIRAISKPDYGNGPWLTALAATALFVAAALFFR